MKYMQVHIHKHSISTVYLVMVRDKRDKTIVTVISFRAVNPICEDYKLLWSVAV